jgi:hypothetical protein
MWIKIENKIINLNTGIVIKINDSPINKNKRIISLEKVGFDKDINLFESEDKKEVDTKFKQIEKYISKRIRNER